MDEWMDGGDQVAGRLKRGGQWEGRHEWPIRIVVPLLLAEVGGVEWGFG